MERVLNSLTTNVLEITIQTEALMEHGPGMICPVHTNDD